MTRKKGTFACVIISCILAVFGLAGLLGGIFGHAWWIHDQTHISFGGKFENGILRYSHKYNDGREDSGFYHDIFKFEQNDATVVALNGEQRDTILLCLIVSGAFTITCLLSMFCGTCRMKRGSWDCATLTSAFLASMSAIPSIGAMIYVEVKFEDRWKDFSDRDRKDSWSYILAWIGTGSLFLCSLSSFILICMKPQAKNTTYHLKSIKVKTTAKTNTGFDSKEDLNKPIQTILVNKKGARTIMESSA